jgi:hypothetical protein
MTGGQSCFRVMLHRAGDGALAFPLIAFGAWWYITKLLFSVHIMRDGLIIQEGHFIPVKPFIDHDDTCYDWNNVEIIDFRPDIPTIMGAPTVMPPLPGVLLDKGTRPFRKDHQLFFPYDTISESFYINQQRGNIPRNIVLFPKPAVVKRKTFGTKLRNGVIYLLILFIVFIGYPLYRGDGIILNAVAPTLAELMPDAVEKAISMHPEWSYATTLPMRGAALAAHATPASLTPIFFAPQNATNMFGYAVLFWLVKFTSRDQQVVLMANFIGELGNPKRNAEKAQ